MTLQKWNQRKDRYHQTIIEEEQISFNMKIIFKKGWANASASVYLSYQVYYWWLRVVYLLTVRPGPSSEPSEPIKVPVWTFAPDASVILIVCPVDAVRE